MSSRTIIFFFLFGVDGFLIDVSLLFREGIEEGHDEIFERFLFIRQELKRILFKRGKIFSVQPVLLNLQYNVKDFVEQFLAEHSGRPAQINLEQKLMARNSNVEFFPHIFSGHKIIDA